MKKYNPLITDLERLEQLEVEFVQAEAVINQRIYNSQTDEKNRIIHLKETRILKGDFANICQQIKQVCLTAMHPDLDVNQVKKGSYFLSSNKTHKLPVKVLELSDELIAILWFSSEGTKFQKTIVVKAIGKEKVKVNYYEFIKGFKTLYGLQQTHFKKLYLTKQSYAFQIQMNQVLFNLTTDEHLKQKLLAKNQRYEQKMHNKY